jgi:hypothetical protein
LRRNQELLLDLVALPYTSCMQGGMGQKFLTTQCVHSWSDALPPARTPSSSSSSVWSA